MDPNQDKRLSRQFTQPVTASDLEEVDQLDVSRPSTPPSFMEPETEDREKSDEQAVRDIADHAGMKAMFLAALALQTDKDQDHDGADSSSMRSFSSQEDLLDNELYDLESAPEAPNEQPEPQLTEVSTADHHSEVPEITVDTAPIDNGGELTTVSHEIEPGDQAEASPQDKTLIDYDADNESDDELNATVVSAQGVQPSVADTGAIVQPHGELNQAVAETSDEVLKFIEERVPHTNLPPEAIVNEVEAVQVVSPVEPHGVFSMMIFPKKNRYLLTKDNGTSLRLVHTNEDDTVIMVMQDDQQVPLTTPFPFDTTFVGNGNGNNTVKLSLGTELLTQIDPMQTLHENAAIAQPQNQEDAK